MTKSIFRFIIAAAVPAFLLSSCGLLPEEDYYASPTIANVESVEYITAVCARGDIIDQEEISFKYLPVQTANLFFEASGIKYDTFFVNVGEAVTEGQLLCQLDLDDYLTQIETLESTRDACEASLSQIEEQRAMALKKQQYQGNGMDSADLQDALDQINSSYNEQRQNLEDEIYITELRLQEYEKKVEERRIYAPFDGIVTYVISYEPYDVSEKTRKAISVSDSTTSLFRAETYYWDSMTPGDVCTITAGERDYTAHVVAPEEYGLEAEEAQEGKTAHVYLALDEPAMNLNEGDTGKVILTLAHAENTLYVPADGVSVINDRTVVYQLGEDGYRTFRYVTTGVSDGKYTEILEGLEEGDEVILN